MKLTWLTNKQKVIQGIYLKSFNWIHVHDFKKKKGDKIHIYS